MYILLDISMLLLANCEIFLNFSLKKKKKTLVVVNNGVSSSKKSKIDFFFSFQMSLVKQ